MTSRDAEMIAAIAAIENEDEGPVVPVPAARQPTQVYSVRIPVERIAELRETAARRNTTPSALIREWVVERLDEHHHVARVVDLTHRRSGAPDLSLLTRTGRRVG